MVSEKLRSPFRFLIAFELRCSRRPEARRCNAVGIYAPINVSPPTRGRVGNFPSLEWHTCPRGRDIESLKCACAIRIVHARGQCGAMLCQLSARRVVRTRVLCLTVDTRVPRFCVWSSTCGYFIKYVWRRKFLSPSREGFEFECCPVGGAIEF